MQSSINGGCLCGAVRYEIRGTLRSVVACHCRQCRKTSGHYVAATQCDLTQIKISAEGLTWYKSSAAAERGFCALCGSNLFWRRLRGSKISIFAGTIDGDSGLVLSSQLHPTEKGDYYDLPDVPVGGQGDQTHSQSKVQKD